jgi:hypothetical protein
VQKEWNNDLLLCSLLELEPFLLNLYSTSATSLDLISGGQISKYTIASHHMMVLKHQVVDPVGVLEAEESVPKCQQATMKLDRFHINTICSNPGAPGECIALWNALQPRRPGKTH